MIYPQILVWQFEYEAGAPQTPVFKDKWQKPVFPARELWVKTLQIIHLNCDRQNFWKNQQSCDIPIFFGFQQDSHVFLRIKLAFNKTSFALGSQHCCAARRYRSSSLEVLAVKASQSHSLRDGQHCHWARSSGSWAQFKDKKMYWAAHACAAGDDRGVCQRAPAWQRVQKTHGKSWQPRAGTIKPAWGPHYGSSSDPKQRLCLPVRLPGCEELWDFKSKSGRKVGDASSVWTFWVFWVWLTMALCAFTKIAFGLLEPSLAAEQVRQLDQALRTHPRGGAAWASLLRSQQSETQIKLRAVS